MATSGLFAKSGTAASNTPIGGIAVANLMTPIQLDDAMRAIVADEYTAIIARGTDIASAGTLDLDGATTPSLNHNITGTTPTTAITLTSGHWRLLRAVGAWPLTASASLIINGSTSIPYTCGADDILLVQGFAAGVVRVWTPSYKSLGTPQATTSGTSIDFTGIPAGVKRITIMLSGVSTTGTSVPIIQLGDSGGAENTGYLGAVGGAAASTAVHANFTDGVGLIPSMAATVVMHGVITLVLLDQSTNTWAVSGTMGTSDAARGYALGFSKSTSATLDRIRITTQGGTDTFDAGKANIMYEG